MIIIINTQDTVLTTVIVTVIQVMVLVLEQVSIIVFNILLSVK